jgi:hypothetical protein
MKKQDKFAIDLMLLVGNVLAIYAMRSQQANNVNSQGDDQSFPVSTLLDELGRKYGYYFTVEEIWNNGETMNKLQSHRIQRPQMGDNILQDLGALSRLVPGMTFKIDEADSKIVHIIDTGLAHQKGYALEQTIDSIDFSGSVFDLVKLLETRGVRVSSRGTIDIHELSTMDFATQVHVKGKQLSVRRALSDFIPLEGRSNRILWVARTKKGSDEISFVRFSLGSPPAKSRAVYCWDKE